MKHKICIVLFVTLVLLNVYDTFSTHTLLTSGQGFYEMNPVMQALMDEFGMVQALVIVKGVLLLWFLSFLLRARTKREWNLLTAGLVVTTGYYVIGMYFLNYQGMLFLSGGKL